MSEASVGNGKVHEGLHGSALLKPKGVMGAAPSCQAHSGRFLTLTLGTQWTFLHTNAGHTVGISSH